MMPPKLSAAAAAVMVVAFGSATVVAQGRAQTSAMTCAQAANLVRESGAIVLGTGGETFDRFVRDNGACSPAEVAANGFARTRDNPSCLVGYHCRERVGGGMGSGR